MPRPKYPEISNDIQTQARGQEIMSLARRMFTCYLGQTSCTCFKNPGDKWPDMQAHIILQQRAIREAEEKIMGPK